MTCLGLPLKSAEWVECPNCRGYGRVHVPSATDPQSPETPWSEVRWNIKLCERCWGYGLVLVEVS